MDDLQKNHDGGGSLPASPFSDSGSATTVGCLLHFVEGEKMRNKASMSMGVKGEPGKPVRRQKL